MNNQNQIQTIAGRLGKNPVQYTRDTKKGRFPVAKFSLACETLGANGPETIWFQCSAWDKRCEIIMKHCRKGDSVQLHGFAKRETYISKKDNTEQSVLAFNVMYVTFLGKSKANLAAEAAQPAQAEAQAVLPGVNPNNPF